MFHLFFNPVFNVSDNSDFEDMGNILKKVVSSQAVINNWKW